MPATTAAGCSQSVRQLLLRAKNEHTFCALGMYVSISCLAHLLVKVGML